MHNLKSFSLQSRLMIGAANEIKARAASASAFAACGRKKPLLFKGQLGEKASLTRDDNQEAAVKAPLLWTTSNSARFTRALCLVNYVRNQSNGGGSSRFSFIYSGGASKTCLNFEMSAFKRFNSHLSDRFSCSKKAARMAISSSLALRESLDLLAASLFFLRLCSKEMSSSSLSFITAPLP
jgi:hypothetical protein